ncbi:hypothetical protein KM043_001212 [Ampulex compressa]|nr:hypothetical protein KM043_001212 [Ampulex compressa]
MAACGQSFLRARHSSTKDKGAGVGPKEGRGAYPGAAAQYLRCVSGRVIKRHVPWIMGVPTKGKASRCRAWKKKEKKGRDGKRRKRKKGDLATKNL